MESIDGSIDILEVGLHAMQSYSFEEIPYRLTIMTFS